MPIQTKDAILWAMLQNYDLEEGVQVNVSIDMPFTVVDKVREYFNINGIVYNSFSFDDLIPYL